jgi:rhodanese-related sulfurtransferase
MKTLTNYFAMIAALMLLVGGMGCGRNPSESSPSSGESAWKSSPQLVDVAEAKRLIAAKQVTILDVRTPDEFSAGHIAGAKNLNFNDRDFQANLQLLDKRQAYLVHCASGIRSARATAAMSNLGFDSVYDLAGGIKAWEQANGEVVK